MGRYHMAPQEIERSKERQRLAEKERWELKKLKMKEKKLSKWNVILKAILTPVGTPVTVERKRRSRQTLDEETEDDEQEATHYGSYTLDIPFCPPSYGSSLPSTPSSHRQNNRFSSGFPTPPPSYHTPSPPPSYHSTSSLNFM